MKERNKSKNDALVPDLGVWVGGGATDREEEQHQGKEAPQWTG